jgi:formylglycine-generating enzyme required for sulfatase activity
VLGGWTPVYVTFEEVKAELTAVGQRLLSPDEWEYARGLGPGTLFAWGDRLGGWGAAETVTGLRLGASNCPELTSVRAEVRGSDWGAADCGGLSEFRSAVVRAPAFRDPETVAGEAGKAGVRGRLYRSAMEVPDVDW